MRPILPSILICLLPVSGAAADAPADRAAESRAAAELNEVHRACLDLAEFHIFVISSINMQTERYIKGKPTAEFSAAVDRAEERFLTIKDDEIRAALALLADVERTVHSLPPERKGLVDLHKLREICDLATRPVGAGDYMILYKAAQRSEVRPVHPFEVKEIQPVLPAAKDQDLQPKSLNVKEDHGPSAASPMSAEEFRRKQERWQARREQEEARELEDLRLRQQQLDEQRALAAERAAAAPPLPSAPKTFLRKDQPPSPQERQRAEQLELKARVETWHQAYIAAVIPFKAALSRMLATPAGRTRARRDACQSLYSAAEALVKSKALAAPDPAVAAPAQAMATKFQAATAACLEAKNEEAGKLMREAEQELGNMAAALAAYGMTP